MKSFEPFYAILAVFIPVSVLAAFMPLAALVLERFTGELPLWLWFASGIFSAITASIYWTLVKRSKADHSTADIRGAILILIVTYTLGSLFRFRWFRPSFYNIPPALIALAIWFPVVIIKRIFGEQDLFESHIVRFDGEKLRQIMLEDSGLLSEADAGLRKLAFRYAIFFLPSIILFFVAGGMRLALKPLLVTLLVTLFTLAVCVIAFINFLRREYALAAEGLILTGRPKAIMAAIIVIISACGAGLFLSSDKSILPHTILTDLLRRIIDFFQSLSRPVTEPPPMPQPAPMQRQGSGLPPELLEMFEETGPSPFWDYVKYAALALAAILFIWFMINPLLGRSRFSVDIRSLPKKALMFLKMWLKALTGGIAYFFGSLKGTGNQKKIRPSSETLRRLENDLLAGYSPAKQRELRRSISLFARLIYWGEEIVKIKWRPNHAPIEYCSLLSQTSQTPSVLRAGELFEKALYSLNPLSGDERKEFTRLINEITK